MIMFRMFSFGGASARQEGWRMVRDGDDGSARCIIGVS